MDLRSPGLLDVISSQLNIVSLTSLELLARTPVVRESINLVIKVSLTITYERLTKNDKTEQL